MSGTRARLRSLVSGNAARRAALLAGAAAAAIAALALLCDRPGLEASYHPLDSVFERPPVFRRIDPTLSFEETWVKPYFSNRLFFGVRWQGWMLIRKEGTHTFRLESTDAATLDIDGTRVIEIRDSPRKLSRRRRVDLDRGLHRIEIALSRSGPELDFTTAWKPPGSASGPIPAELLFARRPGAARMLLRSWAGRFGVAERRLLATALAAIAALLLWLERRSREPWRWARRLSAWPSSPGRRRALELGGLAALFVVTTAWIFPRTGSPFGYDDVRYLNIAAFNLAVEWVTNRYAHVYLLEPFIWLTNGDAFLAARWFWSVQLGVIVSAMAAATRFLAPGRRLATLALGLFLLWSQPLFFVRAGGAVPDFTVGTLLMVSVVLYLHRQSREAPPRWEWHIFLLGLLAVWAIKSKELGVILLWLCACFPFERGRLEWRVLPRKIGAWTAGAATGLVLLAVCDGLLLGDPLFGVRPSNQREVAGMNFEEWPQQGRELEGWMDVVWEGRSPVTFPDTGFKYLALLVLLSALLSAAKKRPIEIRLLHLTPILFLAMLIVVHIRATYVFLARYLYPVIPLACLLAALAVFYLGLDRLRWRDVSSPRFFLPALLLAFVVAGIAVPYQVLWLQPSEFLPAEWLAKQHWTSLDAFIEHVAGPLLILGLAITGALFWRHRPTRLLLAITLIGVLFGWSFFRTTWDLGTRRALQRGESYLYPWRVFGDQISGDTASILVTPVLVLHQSMFGESPTYRRIGRVFLRRPEVTITMHPQLEPGYDYAFLSPHNIGFWRDRWPELEETATVSPSGEVILVRPARARLPENPEDLLITQEKGRR